MSETDNPLGNTPMLRRVRCGHCHLPLVQLYQGDLLYTFQRSGEETASQHLPAYSYRVLTDPTPLLFCPRCSATLSPATVTVVLPRTVVTEEGKAAPRINDL